MCDFISEKVMPVVFLLLGVSAIDSPNNFVRRILLDIVYIIRDYFQLLVDRLN